MSSPRFSRSLPLPWLGVTQSQTRISTSSPASRLTMVLISPVLAHVACAIFSISALLSRTISRAWVDVWGYGLTEFSSSVSFFFYLFFWNSYRIFRRSLSLDYHLSNNMSLACLLINLCGARDLKDPLGVCTFYTSGTLRHARWMKTQSRERCRKFTLPSGLFNLSFRKKNILFARPSSFIHISIIRQKYLDHGISSSQSEMWWKIDSNG